MTGLDGPRLYSRPLKFLLDRTSFSDPLRTLAALLVSDTAKR